MPRGGGTTAGARSTGGWTRRRRLTARSAAHLGGLGRASTSGAPPAARGRQGAHDHGRHREPQRVEAAEEARGLEPRQGGGPRHDDGARPARVGAGAASCRRPRESCDEVRREGAERRGPDGTRGASRGAPAPTRGPDRAGRGAAACGRWAPCRRRPDRGAGARPRREGAPRSTVSSAHSSSRPPRGQVQEVARHRSIEGDVEARVAPDGVEELVHGRAGNASRRSGEARGRRRAPERRGRRAAGDASLVVAHRRGEDVAQRVGGIRRQEEDRGAPAPRRPSASAVAAAHVVLPTPPLPTKRRSRTSGGTSRRAPGGRDRSAAAAAGPPPVPGRPPRQELATAGARPRLGRAGPSAAAHAARRRARGAARSGQSGNARRTRGDRRPARRRSVGGGAGPRADAGARSTRFTRISLIAMPRRVERARRASRASSTRERFGQQRPTGTGSGGVAEQARRAAGPRASISATRPSAASRRSWPESRVSRKWCLDSISPSTAAILRRSSGTLSRRSAWPVGAVSTTTVS